MTVRQEELLQYLATAQAFKEAMEFVQLEYRRVYARVISGELTPQAALDELGHAASYTPPIEHYQFFIQKTTHFKYRASRNIRERERNRLKRRMAGVPTLEDYGLFKAGGMDAEQFGKRIEANMSDAFSEKEKRISLAALQKERPAPAKAEQTPSLDYTMSPVRAQAIMDEINDEAAVAGLTPTQIANGQLAPGFIRDKHGKILHLLSNQRYNADSDTIIEIQSNDPLQSLQDGASLFGD